MRAMTQRRRALIAAAANSKINLVDVSAPLYPTSFGPDAAVDFSSKHVFFRYAGSGYCNQDVNYSSSGDGFTFTTAQSYYGAGFNIDVSPGETYTIATSINSISSGAGRLSFTWYDANRRYISANYSSHYNAGDAVFTQTAPQNAAYAICTLAASANNSAVVTNNFGVYKE